jgi:CysZ protein
LAELQAASGRTRLGFASGVATLPRAFAEISRTPELWAFSLVPSLIFFLLMAVFGAAAVLGARPWLGRHLPAASSAFGRIGEDALGWTFVALLVWAGWYVALALAPVLSAPALERIVHVVERRAGAPARAPLGFWRELGCGLRSLAGAACVAVPLSSVLSLVGFVFPAVTPVTLPLALVLGALLVAWSLFDYPLTLRGFGFRDRLRFVREHFVCIAGFGAAFALAFWLPCCAVVLLPAGTVAATRLSARILFATPPGP